MRVLWMVNQFPKDFSESVGLKGEYFGGWIEAMIDRLKDNEEIQLFIAAKSPDSKRYEAKAHGVSYFSVEYGAKVSLTERCKEIIENVNPDIVQIDGTEFPHAEAMFDAARALNKITVVSLQGILEGLYPYECGELPIDEMMLSASFTNIYTAWTLYFRKKIWFKPRVAREKRIIGNARYLLGRTLWDRAHSYKLNPKAGYFKVNRVLRAPFYENKWSIEKTERHSIYVGNGYSSLKGFQYVIGAMPYLKREYPDVKVYVAGPKPYTENDKRPFYKKGFGAYLKKIIKDNDVEGNIEFLGPLNALQVAERLSKTNVYILSSTIENSPNSLGEAMLVGTPCVSSYAGGASDMAVDEYEALFYRSNDPAMLAWQIKRLFDDDELCLKLSSNAKKHAEETHNPIINAKALTEAYKIIYKSANVKDGKK